MKSIIMVFYVAISFVFSSNSQDIPTEQISFKVFGNCNMCKNRIEKAVDIKEVKYSKWDKHSKMLKLIYETSITPDSLQKRITLFGHDTEKFKAPDDVYKKLPKCCLYRDNNKTH